MRDMQAWVRRHKPPLCTFLPDRLRDPAETATNQAQFRSLSRMLFENQMVSASFRSFDSEPLLLTIFPCLIGCDCPVELARKTAWCRNHNLPCPKYNCHPRWRTLSFFVFPRFYVLLASSYRGSCLPDIAYHDPSTSSAIAPLPAATPVRNAATSVIVIVRNITARIQSSSDPAASFSSSGVAPLWSIS